MAQFPHCRLWHPSDACGQRVTVLLLWQGKAAHCVSLSWSPDSQNFLWEGFFIFREKTFYILNTEESFFFSPTFCHFSSSFFSNFLQSIASTGRLAHLVTSKTPLSLCCYTTARIQKRKMGKKQGTTSCWQSKWMRKIQTMQFWTNTEWEINQTTLFVSHKFCIEKIRPQGWCSPSWHSALQLMKVPLQLGSSAPLKEAKLFIWESFSSWCLSFQIVSACDCMCKWHPL